MARDKKQPLILPAVEMTGIADKGLCVGRHEGGKVVFVENAAPGDVADVRVFKRTKAYYLASPVQFHRYSADRVQPFCSHYGVCGGCKWQHLGYEAQLRHKTQVVQDALQRIGKVEVGEWLPMLGAQSDTFYRNKLEFAFSNKRWLTVEELEQGLEKDADVLGFHRPGAFDKVLDIEKCWLQPEPSNAIRNGIKAIALAQGLSFYDLKGQHGLLRNLMLRITSLGEVMALISFGESQPEQIKGLLDEALRQFPQITTLCYCINTKSNDTIYDLEVLTHHGKGYVEEMLGAVKFRIGPKSFFQTNTAQATRLYDVVVDFAQLQGHENVYDLYTGIGSIALYVARRCKKVVGIEEIEAAIDDARENAALNQIENVAFYAGDVRHMLTNEFARQHGRPDLLITDPPRAGMHPDVVRMLLELESPRIVYVSCNPATQARDVQLLGEKYDVLKVQPVDMFPHTHHMESVALLQLKKT